LTTKQSENGIYILPPLPITKRKPFTLLRKDDDDDEQTNVEDVKESEFRRLFQTVDDASSLHKEPTSPHHDGILHVDQEQEEERRVKELVDQTARLMESTPRRMSLESSTAQSTNNTTNNNSSIYTTPPRSLARWYMGSATSAVSPMFPAFGSVESIRHEQPPWTPDGPRQGGSELDLFELNNETPIKSVWPPNQ
jgi:hypothetical protein